MDVILFNAAAYMIYDMKINNNSAILRKVTNKSRFKM